ncbi:hypothetical protein [Catenulispora subtropica]|uniref:Uncharacterized protein n=1 Tax=Catenulispora subtropica TaxID=450798 RepID=A0ABN2TE43_9ACTN
METRDHVQPEPDDRDEKRGFGRDDEFSDAFLDHTGGVSEESGGVGACDECGSRGERGGPDERERGEGRDTAIFTLGEETARIEQPELHRLLRGIADEVAPSPRGDFFPQVLKRAAVMRRRRRAVRASSATAVLVAAVILAPTVARELGVRGGAAVAAPPSAVVDMASAYPEADASATELVPLVAAKPANALNWGTRGDALPGEAVQLAGSYVTERGVAGASGSGGASNSGEGSQSDAAAAAAGAADAARSQADADVTASAASASVTTLWAGVEDDTTGVVPSHAGDIGINVNGSPERLVQQDAHKTWLFVMQGWRVGPDGAPASQAVLLVGEYTQSAGESSMTVHSTPVVFAHARPGSGDDKNDTDQIAELSIWLPESGRLLVLGAPQTKTVLYAKTGGDLIPQKTIDGVALFPRTRSLVKGQFADTVQVRDAKNVALTPPKAWSAGDFALSGVEWRWRSTEPGWVSVAAGSPVPAPVLTPVPAPSKAGPVVAPPSKTSPPTATGHVKTSTEPPAQHR